MMILLFFHFHNMESIFFMFSLSAKVSKKYAIQCSWKSYWRNEADYSTALSFISFNVFEVFTKVLLAKKLDHVLLAELLEREQWDTEIVERIVIFLPEMDLRV